MGGTPECNPKGGPARISARNKGAQRPRAENLGGPEAKPLAVRGHARTRERSDRLPKASRQNNGPPGPDSAGARAGSTKSAATARCLALCSRVREGPAVVPAVMLASRQLSVDTHITAW